MADPLFEWGPISPGDVGTLLGSDGDFGGVRVRFPKHPFWYVQMGDLEVVKQDDLRLERLRAGPTMLLYHQTSAENARKILSSQRLLRGSQGLAGGGIYFAASAAETAHKAQAKGVILQARVRLGKRMEVQESAVKTTYRSLLDQGYDSVFITRRKTGLEYVVYNYDQVTDIRRYG
eukprot:CAMPEP_0206533446 /NCGR_PEP_ID=MMETSP0325_2-20121206/4965_1 /ASSEMBLY_ACC=CAM_ASM_000347 /TAXON_ID=2866 /ORGANISM="Crypthecodinium cohnii, Strain Seligo" /LENGTH=175 /DNA_ID=CAMNT_0054030081 /DNA_START=143 /DNA_END=670 /DNA_ORIENTATION=+